eukprot:TRINITY_DN67777_c0_g1_i1.p1 TRINITY_DN67777_c0_g1~~TRINITY_DN67777_c0_g1_i1.p1  ORF type:complete len:389 (+),score=31.57 TRINITY_DN67777_c0_g1_i1:46-1167(+)
MVSYMQRASPLFTVLLSWCLVAPAVAELISSVVESYPGYAGVLNVTGVPVVVETRAGPTGDPEQVIRYSLAGVDQNCGLAFSSEPLAPNGCGIHIHEGVDCASAGGHFWNKLLHPADPWKTVRYTAEGTRSSGTTPSVHTGLSEADLAGRTVVIHDASGARVACAVLGTPSADVVGEQEPHQVAGEATLWTWGLIIGGGLLIGTGIGGCIVLYCQIRSVEDDGHSAAHPHAMQQADHGNQAPRHTRGVDMAAIPGQHDTESLAPLMQQSPTARTSSPLRLAPTLMPMPQAAGLQPAPHTVIPTSIVRLGTHQSVQGTAPVLTSAPSQPPHSILYKQTPALLRPPVNIQATMAQNSQQVPRSSFSTSIPGGRHV